MTLNMSTSRGLRKSLLVSGISISTSLLLFLTTYWYFFSYGSTNLALTAPLEDIITILLLSPIILIPLFNWIISHKVLNDRQSTLFLLIFGIGLSLILIVDLNPVFSSHWTWAYQDLRELNYFHPVLKSILITAEFMAFSLQVAKILQYRKEIDTNSGYDAIFVPIIISFFVFGVIQTNLVNQPLWFGLMVIFWVIIMEGVMIFWDKHQGLPWKANKLPFKPTESTEPNSEQNSMKHLFQKIVSVLLFFVILLFSIWCWLLPAQMVFQDSPTTAWGQAVWFSALVGILPYYIWRKTKFQPLFGFGLLLFFMQIPYLILGYGTEIIPNSVEWGKNFAFIGGVGLLLWILFHGIKAVNHTKGAWQVSERFLLNLIWVWGFAFVIFMNDPIFEIWEFEETLRDAAYGLFPDQYGSGVGSYYQFAANLSLAMLAILTPQIIFREQKVKNFSAEKLEKDKILQKSDQEIHTTTNQENNEAKPKRELKTPIRATRKSKAITLLIGIMLITTAVSVNIHETQASSPTIVAHMGDHGVLWEANSYDRVLPKYRPSFLNYEVNSTLSLSGMKGENEMLQLVYTPLISKMISFQYYQWSSTLSTRGNMMWQSANGSMVAIPITAGKVGYLECYDPNIGDIMSDWNPFITGTRDNIPFWISVAIPREIDAGIYTTEFEFITTSYLQRVPTPMSLKFTLELNVWNFTKPLNRTIDTVIGYQVENPAKSDELIKFGFEYGLDPYGIGSPQVAYDINNLSAGLTINWTSFDARVQEMLDAGMNQIKLDFYPGIDCRNHAEAVVNGSQDDYLTLIKWFYENASIHLSSKLTPWGTTWESETITQHSDEPDPRIDPYSIAAFDKLYKIIDNATTIRTLQTFAYEPEFDEWLDSLDIWVFTPDSFTEEISAKIHAAGRECWTYSNGDNFPGTDSDLETPLYMSRLRGWVDYHYNISGFLHWIFYWNYNDAGRSGCGYDGRGDGTEIVPGPNGYLPTLRLNAFRDSLEDAEVLWKLNRTIQLAELVTEGNPSLTTVLNQAKIILQKVDLALEAQPADAKWDLPVVTREFRHDPQYYLDLRIECGKILTQLLDLV